ncbi:hypothetical protein TorRG33x02_294220 [Trema orientale]|uniref:DUF8039 domain-containing protein n=1 Tax=Trema orientale TaxID=63057 RepID=A0A2P5C8B4_TREOI|nr:hypothetical protein TorRG33x02_294220 [Trema orientale]
MRAEIDKMNTQIESLTSIIKVLQNAVFEKEQGCVRNADIGEENDLEPPSGKASCTAHQSTPGDDPNIGILCKLAVATKENIVASGKVYYDCGPDSLLHGIPLGKGNLRVSVLIPIQPDVEVPIPTEEVQTVLDAQGVHIAWPASLVLYETKVQ